jgi:hypothetical protein
MDVNDIFDLFKEDNKNEEFEGDNNELSPKQILFCLGMFTKLISNIKGFSLKTTITLKKFPLEKDIEDEIKNKSNNYIHNKALFFLTQITLSKKYHCDIVSKNVTKDLITAIQISKEYFLKTEEYEKCKILQDFENFFHLNLV